MSLAENKSNGTFYLISSECAKAKRNLQSKWKTFENQYLIIKIKLISEFFYYEYIKINYV
jgi:hypothetical protein